MNNSVVIIFLLQFCFVFKQPFVGLVR